MHTEASGGSGVYLGPVTIGGTTVLLRPPRLSDGDSWRRTNLGYAEKLKPAFAREDMDWEAAHAPSMWVHRWRTALADNKTGIAYVLVRLEKGAEDVVGFVCMAGRHPRTGGAEISVWTAGVAPEVTRWALATVVLDGFENRTGIPHVLAPTAVDNHTASKLIDAMGWPRLYVRRLLRPFDGAPADHDVWALVNNPEGRQSLREKIATVDATPSELTPPRRWPSLREIAGLARFGVRQTRHRLRTAPVEVVDQTVLQCQSAAGPAITLVPEQGRGYRIMIDDTPLGVIGLSVDLGSSTTELLPRFGLEVSHDDLTSALAEVARHLVDTPSSTRSIVFAAPDGDASVAERLTALGFSEEGPAMPTLGEHTPRRLWAHVRTS